MQHSYIPGKAGGTYQKHDLLFVKLDVLIIIIKLTNAPELVPDQASNP